MSLSRAYSLLTVKAVDEDKRTITGIATTPSPDRVGDIVEPEGAEFKLPIPLLWQHDSSQPIGHVTAAEVTSEGIEVTARIEKAEGRTRLGARLDEAWESIKMGLVRGLSIGFRSLERTFMEDTDGIRFLRWEWLELSAVTIPANTEASIQTVKSIDAELRAAHGRKEGTASENDAPGASGKRVVKTIPKDGTMTQKKTLSEQISDFEATRQAKAARMTEIMEESGEKGETLDAEQQEEYDGLAEEVKAIDEHLTRLRPLEKANRESAKPIEGKDPDKAAASRSGVQVKVGKDNLPPGIRFARLAKVKALSRLDGRDRIQLAKEMYPNDEMVQKATVEAGNTIDTTWAGSLVGTESSVFADFVEWLRPTTILGKFGVDGIPPLRMVPFRTRLVSQTSGGAAFWTAEGKAKPLTKFDFASTTLSPLKIANIAVTTMELLRDSSPSAELLVRDQLAAALRAKLDTDFIDPSVAAVANVSPASITNGATAINSTGTDADAVRQDIKNLISGFIAANNSATAAVFIMKETVALTLSLMRNALGQKEFPDVTVRGGFLEGIPVITSEFVPVEHTSPANEDYVILVNAGDIYFADEGGIAIDMSMEASLEMEDAPGHGSANTDSPAGSSGTSLVSLWQTNSVGFRAERTLNWARRRTEAVQVLGSVQWSVVTA